MSYLELNHLVKEYQKGKQIVKGIDLSIEKGEFVVFLGPSGCGKTTTLRMIAGLEDVTGGDITIEGKSIVGLEPAQREFSMIFQSYAVWPHMTVYNNIAYPLKLKKRPKAEIDKTVRSCAEVCGLSEYLDRYPSQLSGGQRQRVAVARAIAVKPRLFLMDEPLSNLDAKLRVSVRTFLKQVHIDNHATTIFVTHDQAEALALADKIVVMKGGVIEQIGSPTQIYQDCETMFVANFLGTPPANFLHVELTEKNGELLAVSRDVTFPVPAALRESLRPYLGKKVVAAIRPENVRVNEPGSCARAEIKVVEPQGSYTILMVMLDDTEFKIMCGADVNYTVGQVLELGFKPEGCMFFDPDTERRIR